MTKAKKSGKVSAAQADHVRRMADQKGIGGKIFQDRFIDDGLCAIALDTARQKGARLKRIPPIVAPTGWGGRIHFVEVEVDESQPWPEAVMGAGPNTLSGYDVHKVADHYPPTGRGKRKVKMVLVSLANGGNFAKAVAWAEQYDLRRTSPRQVFAIGKNKPELHKELSMDPMYVVASQECAFGGYRQVCDVWWNGSARVANLFWVDFVRYPLDWVAFLRE